MRLAALTIGFVLLFTTSASAWHTEKHELLADAVEILTDMQGAADERIPQVLIQKAKAIIIIPTLLKGGFMLGARYGEGVATVRDPYTGKWGAPAFITSAGASFGFQAGAQAIDLVLLVMSEKGIKGLLKDNFTLGGDIALTAGPVGRYAEAGSDILLQGEIYSYSRSKGLFGGVSLKGTVIQPNEEKNRSYYGMSLKAQNILMSGAVKRAPKTAQVFMEKMNRIAPPPSNPYAGTHMARNNAPAQQQQAAQKMRVEPTHPPAPRPVAPAQQQQRVQPAHPQPQKKEPLW